MGKERLKELSDTLNRVLASPYSSFYKDFYARKMYQPPSAIASLEEWRTIPMMSKEELKACPVKKRTYQPWENLDYIRATSGTTGMPLYIPRMPQRTHEVAMRRHNGASRTLLFFQPHHFIDLMLRGGGLPSVAGDPSNLAYSAFLAKQCEVDALFIIPNLLPSFIPYLQKEGLCEEIRYIMMCSDRVTLLEWRLFRKTFPNAMLVSGYSSTEAEGVVGLSKPQFYDEPPPIKPFPHSFWEIVDKDGVPVPEGVDGELVLTTMRKNDASPLMRYKTGDRAHKIPDAEDLYQFFGRLELDVVRFPNGEIKSVLLDKAIIDAALSMGVTILDYEAHITENLKTGAVLPRLEIKVRSGKPVELETFAQKVSALLKISPSKSYVDAFNEGLCEALLCTPLEEVASTGVKRVRLFDHRA